MDFDLIWWKGAVIMEKQILTWDRDRFYMNGNPFRILSGAIHYFRVVPGYWEDRLNKLKACGFNCVETVVCWNLHEPEEGRFVFSGPADIAAFLEKARQAGLYVILRPGPYICAEWEFGGFPSWLLSNKSMRLRCTDELFLEKVRNYFHALIKQIRPYLGDNGGNVIAMQVENEYGSYGNDHGYMEALLKIYREEGISCLLFTSDGPTYHMLNGGSIPGVLSGVNFGSGPAGSFALKKELDPDQPLFCCEYWNGWFDHWHEKHHERGAGDTAAVLEEILRAGASVNLYLFHGGTNFGFYNGANHEDGYQPTVTSYDYNAPLSENGDMTEKYAAVKEAAARCSDGTFFGYPCNPDKGAAAGEPKKVVNMPRKDYGSIEPGEYACLFNNLTEISRKVVSSAPMSMEELGQDYGFVLYRKRFSGPFERLPLIIDGLRDRAIIYIDGIFAGIKERSGKRDDPVFLELNAGETALVDILVENQGRINYGAMLRDEKGILGGVRLDRQYQFGWEMYPLDCRNLEGLVWKRRRTGGSEEGRPYESQAAESLIKEIRPHAGHLNEGRPYESQAAESLTKEIGPHAGHLNEGRPYESQAADRLMKISRPAQGGPANDTGSWNDSSADGENNGGYGPVFLKGTFWADSRADTFVLPVGFEKGCVWINGFHLGRYWNSAGPQKTLYLPAPLLRDGENELIVLELEHMDERNRIMLIDTPDLG